MFSTPRMNFFIREEMIFDVTRELEKISTNTLILSGRYDVQCPLSFSVEMNELKPNSQFKQSKPIGIFAVYDFRKNLFKILKIVLTME